MSSRPLVVLVSAWSLAVVAALGCAGVGGGASGGGASGGSTGSGGPTAGGGRTGAGGSPGAGGVPASTGTGGRGTGGSGVRSDAGSPSGDAACSQLNIGILGNPGSNSSSNFQAWLEARGTSARRFQTDDGTPLTADALQPFDVIVIDLPPREYTADEAAVLAAWVSAGGGIAAMSGYHNDTSQDWRANSLLAPLGVAYSGQLVWGPVTQFAAHPITTGLTSVTFTGGYGVSDLGTAGSTRTPIAFLPGNPGTLAVAYAVTMGQGRAFVWGDEWIEFDSEWSSMPQIPQLWLQVFNWIAPPNRCMLTGIMISCASDSEGSGWARPWGNGGGA
ncbi:MAG TPA: hypothetical protein VHO67_07650 [Polyangia bacterium]|nr:hypothetical protein [Polyangia bacterium]